MSELEAFLQEMGDFKSQCINIANASDVSTKHALIEHIFVAYIRMP